MTAAERRWGLAAAIASIAVFGIGIGISGPLLSLMLEGRGVDSSLTGHAPFAADDEPWV